MSYTNQDFSESLNRVGINPADVDTVIAAWGSGSGMGTDTGPGWTDKGATEWAGGFLMKLKDGRYAYVSGWCDYTGWGCQDGATVQYFHAQPVLADMKATDEYTAVPHDWDETPADLNLWLAKGAPDPYYI
jgi:hypothetical protein